MTVTWSRASNIRFAGLMSRWTIPFSWAAWRARAAARILAGEGIERPAVHELHGDERPLLVPAELVDGADAGVAEPGGGPRLAAEALEHLGVFALQELERDPAPELGVPGFPHLAHAAAAEARDADIFPDEGALGWRFAGVGVHPAGEYSSLQVPRRRFARFVARAEILLQDLHVLGGELDLPDPLGGMPRVLVPRSARVDARPS
jgi:hypothetical protein